MKLYILNVLLYHLMQKSCYYFRKSPKCIRFIFGLFLNFGKAIVIKVLMLNFYNSCTNRPSCNEHGNVFSAKRSFIEKKL